MKLKIRVLALGSPACDGSYFDREVVEEYLASPEYRHDIESHNMLGGLTHRGRSVKTLPSDVGNVDALSKTIGKDDSFLLLNKNWETPVFTHYVNRFYIVDNDIDGKDWVYADVTVLDENLFDEQMAAGIRRLKGLIRSGVKVGISLVAVCYWSGPNSERAAKIKRWSGIDLTMNQSFGPYAQVTDVYDDEKSEEKEFSEIEAPREGELFVKTFSTSDFAEFTADTPKTSKINGQFTKLAVKQFSCASCVSEIADTQDASTLNSESIEATTESAIQKEFTVAGVKDRLREYKISQQSPRFFFRRVYLSYKQILKSGNLSDEDMKILKSMFTSDVLFILNKIQPEILQGKQINTLLGCSSLSTSCRKAAQQLQMPFRLAMQELNRQGFLSKVRYQKLQDAYIEFVHALIDDVFGPKVEDVITAPASDAVRKMEE